MKSLHACFVQLLSAALPLMLLQATAARYASPEVASRPVPAERVQWVPALTPSQPVATLHVIREARSLGRAKPTTLTLDGRDVAEIHDGENLMMRIPPGAHVLGLRYASPDALPPHSTGLARGTAYIESMLKLTEGKYHDFHIVPDAQWNWQLDSSRK